MQAVHLKNYFENGIYLEHTTQALAYKRRQPCEAFSGTHDESDQGTSALMWTSAIEKV